MVFDNAFSAETSACKGESAAEPVSFLTFAEGKADSSRQKLQLASIAELFGDPVIDAVPGAEPPADQSENVLPSLLPSLKGGQDLCAGRAATKNLQESLDSTAKGDSILHRMYEVAVKTPQGTLMPKDFASAYGKLAAAKMDELGITRVQRSGSRINVSLKAPLHFDGESGSLDIEKSVSFSTSPKGGAVELDGIRGVSATSGLFRVAIDQVDLQPRQEGYLSGQVRGGLSASRICVSPDGKISR